MQMRNKRANFEEVGHLAKDDLFVRRTRTDHQSQHFGVKLCPRNLMISEFTDLSSLQLFLSEFILRRKTYVGQRLVSLSAERSRHSVTRSAEIKLSSMNTVGFNLDSLLIVVKKIVR